MALAFAACGAPIDHDAAARAAVDQYLAPFHGREATEAYAALSRKSASQLNRAAYLRAAETQAVDPQYYDVAIESLEIEPSEIQAKAVVNIVMTDPQVLNALAGFGGETKESVDMSIQYGLVYEDGQWKIDLDDQQLAFEKSRLANP